MVYVCALMCMCLCACVCIGGRIKVTGAQVSWAAGGTVDKCETQSP